MAKDKEREYSFGVTLKKIIMAVSIWIEETQWEMVEETHRNG